MDFNPKTATPDQMQALFRAADEAGKAAADATTPDPMTVGTRGPDGSFTPIETVADGVCGFAWINIKGGGSRFARWLKRNGLARKDHYHGGVTVWVSGYRQSMTLKAAYAGAFANVLREHGIIAYSMSRMD